MRVVGLITEYNPFHNGHLHHLRESLVSARADASVAIMSGHFLQRGEPALVDKWVRTEMALAAGVDLVLELPTAFACNSAPHFAMGAIQSLQALGVVDAVCFGSESGDLALLDTIASVLVHRHQEIEARTTARLRDGVNYPAARAEILAAFLPEVPAGVLGSSNNILGVAYLKALRTIGSRIAPYTIKRRGAGYHETEVVGRVASATGIRKRLNEGATIDGLLPRSCVEILARAIDSGQSLDTERLFVAMQTPLLQGPEALQEIYLVEDGLERRLSVASQQAASFDALVTAINSRQWTRTRIQRALMAVLLQIKTMEMTAFLQTGPLYLRVLGHSDRGRQVLSRARRRKTLPMVADPARATHTLRKFYRNRSTLPKLATEMLHLDLRATRLYGLLQKNRPAGSLNQDYYQPVRQV